MDKVLPITRNRYFVMDLLTRARKFHCPVTTAWQFDIENLNAGRLTQKVNGRPLSMTACLAKATGLLLKAHPRLNHHLFTGVFRRYEVAFETVCCTLVVMRRGPKGERILLPLLIDKVDELSVIEIQKIIDVHRYGKLEDLPQFAAAERIKSMPRLALSWFSFKSRSDHRFYRRYFGTYGISEMATGSFGPRGGHIVANTASAFVVGPRFNHTELKNGQLTTRLMQGITLVSDHYIVDGIDILLGMKTFEKLLSDPNSLGLGQPVVT